MTEKHQACQTTLEYNDTPEKDQASQTEDQILQSQKSPIQHAANLKIQILELAKSLDLIVEKEKQKRIVDLPNQEFLQQQKVIKEQMQEMDKLKQAIRLNQRRLQISTDEVKLNQYEEELQKQLKLEQELKMEYNSIKKIQLQQQQVLGFLNVNDHRETKQQELKEEKQKGRQYQEQIRNLEQRLKRKHENHYQQNERLKWMDSRMVEQRRKNRKNISQDDISILENQLQEILIEIDNKSIQYQTNIRFQERERKKLSQDLDYKERILKEKEKEYKLVLLKHNELLRLTKKLPLQPLKFELLKEDIHRPQNTPNEN